LKYTRRQLMTASPAVLLSALRQAQGPVGEPVEPVELAERLLVVENKQEVERIMREWDTWHILRRLQRIEKQVRTPGPYPENLRKPT
jgi:hypothetical protein